MPERLGWSGTTRSGCSEEFGDRPDDPHRDDPLDVAVWQSSGRVTRPGRARGAPVARAGTPSARRWRLAARAGVDLLAGGADLTFPHHAYQAAMAEAVTGCAPSPAARLRSARCGRAGRRWRSRRATWSWSPTSWTRWRRRCCVSCCWTARGRGRGTSRSRCWGRPPNGWTGCTRRPAAGRLAGVGGRQRPPVAAGRSRRAGSAGRRGGVRRLGRPARPAYARTRLTECSRRRMPHAPPSVGALQSGPDVVVGLDNGGTSNNATVLDVDGPVPRRPAGRDPEPGRGGAGAWRSRRSPQAMDDVLERDRQCRATGPRGRAGHPGPGQRRRRHLVAGLDQLLPRRLARLRRPRRARGRASACRSSTTTTATPPRSTPTTCHFGDRRRRAARRSRRSSAPGSAAA